MLHKALLSELVIREAGAEELVGSEPRRRKHVQPA